MMFPTVPSSSSRSLAARLLAAVLAFAAHAAIADNGEHDRDRDRDRDREWPTVATSRTSTDAPHHERAQQHRLDGHDPQRQVLGGGRRRPRRQPLPPGDRPARQDRRPGLFDNHNHIILLGLRPGRHTPIETAPRSPIAKIYKDGSRARDRAFITSIGGFNPVQFAEKRCQTLAELDAIAPSNPSTCRSRSPARDDQQRGKAFFRAEASPAAPTARSGPTRRRSRRSTRCARCRASRQEARHRRRHGLRRVARRHVELRHGRFRSRARPTRGRVRLRRRRERDPYTAYDPILDLHARPDEGCACASSS